ncbi:hypothetical protein Ddye_024458 [Dipteronia dyeriana]|uniref:Uncharacterized protein n=1 Tax=Dipteronia dyeriana TaxID=168575 RepID=A0AAD9TUU9_9ROSI|nr:hypothetical protein Ddye_024458 [Dipteronia dyeriana]
MELKLANLGSSLPMPFVQELAKEPLTAVPPRYQDPPFISNTTSSPQVPVWRLHGIRVGEVSLCMPRMGFLPVDKSWGEHTVGEESEGRDSRVFQAANGGEEQVLSTSRRPRGIWVGLCGV